MGSSVKLHTASMPSGPPRAYNGALGCVAMHSGVMVKGSEYSNLWEAAMLGNGDTAGVLLDASLSADTLAVVGMDLGLLGGCAKDVVLLADSELALPLGFRDVINLPMELFDAAIAVGVGGAVGESDGGGGGVVGAASRSLEGVAAGDLSAVVRANDDKEDAEATCRMPAAMPLNSWFTGRLLSVPSCNVSCTNMLRIVFFGGGQVSVAAAVVLALRISTWLRGVSRAATRTKDPTEGLRYVCSRGAREDAPSISA